MVGASVRASRKWCDGVGVWRGGGARTRVTIGRDATGVDWQKMNGHFVFYNTTDASHVLMSSLMDGITGFVPRYASNRASHNAWS